MMGYWLDAAVCWGSPSGPSLPLALTLALSRPAGEGTLQNARVSPAKETENQGGNVRRTKGDRGTTDANSSHVASGGVLNHDVRDGE